MNPGQRLITVPDYKALELEFITTLHADMVMNILDRNMQLVPAGGWLRDGGNGNLKISTPSDGGDLISKFNFGKTPGEPGYEVFVFDADPVTCMPIETYGEAEQAAKWFGIPVDIEHMTKYVNTVMTVVNADKALKKKARRIIRNWEREFANKAVKTWRDWQVNEDFKKIVGRALGRALGGLWARILHSGAPRKYKSIYTTARRLVGLKPVSSGQHYGSSTVRQSDGSYKNPARVNPRGRPALHYREIYHRWLIRQALRRKTERHWSRLKRWKYTVPRTDYPRPGERHRYRGPLSKRVAKIWASRIPSLPKKRVPYRRGRDGIVRPTKISVPDLWHYRNMNFEYWMDYVVTPSLVESAKVLRKEVRHECWEYLNAQLKGTKLENVKKWLKLYKKSKRVIRKVRRISDKVTNDPGGADTDES